MGTVIQSILYFFGIGENPIEPPKQRSDADALRMDWEKVSRDMNSVISK